MRKEQKDIDELGPIGITRETFKLLLTHSKFLMLTQLTLILPIAFLVVTTECLIYWILPEHNRPPPGTVRIPHLPNNFKIALDGVGHWQFYLAVFAVVLISAVVAFLLEAAKGLSSSAIVYAVGLNYTGQSISFKAVLHACIPGLWMRLTVTNVYKFLIVYSMMTVQTFCSLLLVRIHLPLPVVLIGVATIGVLVIVGVVVLDIVFILATGVSVLEKDYGWAAVSRTLKLLKGRVVIAVLLRLLWMVPSVLTLGIQRASRYQITEGKFSPWSVTVPLLIVHICWLSFVWEMRALCAGVQYASFKAYHNEDLAESIYEKQLIKGGYAPVGDKIDDELGGQTAQI